MTNLPNTYIQYNWDVDKKNKLKDLDTRVIIKGEERYTFNYKKEKNITTIKKRERKKTITTTKPGFVSVTIKTNGAGIEVDY